MIMGGKMVMAAPAKMRYSDFFLVGEATFGRSVAHG